MTEETARMAKEAAGLSTAGPLETAVDTVIGRLREAFAKDD